MIGPDVLLTLKSESVDSSPSDFCAPSATLAVNVTERYQGKADILQRTAPVVITFPISIDALRVIIDSFVLPGRQEHRGLRFTTLTWLPRGIIPPGEMNPTNQNDD
ncbi:hypothetical protein KEM48_012294 [Puccinia striiformis f. sp. tritici PST-130]|nr:hypothetical protein H4Q26_013063 [Puccinia striiformis f. sp. tritici PST-130]KAI9630087.1 hypothetical protein KEM48_012294 [Puccinia striiformis f. sp. tritici PST-130]